MDRICQLLLLGGRPRHWICNWSYPVQQLCRFHATLTYLLQLRYFLIEMLHSTAVQHFNSSRIYRLTLYYPHGQSGLTIEVWGLQHCSIRIVYNPLFSDGSIPEFPNFQSNSFVEFCTPLRCVQLFGYSRTRIIWKLLLYCNVFFLGKNKW